MISKQPTIPTNPLGATILVRYPNGDVRLVQVTAVCQDIITLTCDAESTQIRLIDLAAAIRTGQHQCLVGYQA